MFLQIYYNKSKIKKKKKRIFVR